MYYHTVPLARSEDNVMGDQNNYQQMMGPPQTTHQEESRYVCCVEQYNNTLIRGFIMTDILVGVHLEWCGR